MNNLEGAQRIGRVLIMKNMGLALFALDLTTLLEGLLNGDQE